MGPTLGKKNVTRSALAVFWVAAVDQIHRPPPAPGYAIDIAAGLQLYRDPFVT